MDLVRDLVAAGVTTLVLAQDRDSLARTPAYHYLLHREFEEYSCKVRSLELTHGILDQLAKFVRAKTVERTRRSKLQKAREGKMLAVHGPLYGFRYNERTKVIFSARLWKRRRRPRLSPRAV
jgi:site-specific DNA recombinase